MLRRRLAVFCSLIAVLSILVAACAPPAAAPEAAPAEGAAPAAAPAAAAGVAVSPAGEFPIVSEPLTIKAFLCPNSSVKDYNDNEYARDAQEVA